MICVCLSRRILLTDEPICFSQLFIDTTKRDRPLKNPTPSSLCQFYIMKLQPQGGEGYVHQALSGIASFAVIDMKIVNITLKFTSIFNFRQNEPMTCLLVKIPTYYWLDKDTYVWFIMAAKYTFENLMLYHLLMKASFELVALLKQESYVYKDVIRGGFIFYPTPLKIR